jgi:hypothetical protein
MSRSARRAREDAGRLSASVSKSRGERSMRRTIPRRPLLAQAALIENYRSECRGRRF